MVETKNSKEFLRITSNQRFNSTLLTRDKSLSNPSFRIYYGGASGTVPFLWESQPGTPKNDTTSTTLPPLTPPPSYTFTHNKKKFANRRSSSSAPKLNSLMDCIIPKAINKQMTNLLSSSSSVSSSSERSSSSLESGDDASSPKSTIRYRGNGSFKGCCYSLW